MFWFLNQICEEINLYNNIDDKISIINKNVKTVLEKKIYGNKTVKFIRENK